MKVKRHYYILTIFILIVFSIIILRYSNQENSSEFKLNTAIDKYNLVTHTGKKFNNEYISNIPSLLFFGFLNCPDVCPNTLIKISEIITDMENIDDNVRFYFITVDPERDTVENMKDYLSNFNDNIIGVTGAPDSIDNFLKYMYVYSKKVFLNDSEYTFDHSSQVFLYRRNGSFFGTFSLTESNKIIYDKIYKIINGA